MSRKLISSKELNDTYLYSRAMFYHCSTNEEYEECPGEIRKDDAGKYLLQLNVPIISDNPEDPLRSIRIAEEGDIIELLEY